LGARKPKGVNRIAKIPYISASISYMYPSKLVLLYLVKVRYWYGMAIHENKLSYIFQAYGIDIRRLSMKIKNLKVLGARKPKGVNRIAKIG
jgi:hypothetical protein